MTGTPATTAGDMTDMLRRHYLPEGKPPGGLLADEIESPCHTRRADAIWLPTTVSGGMTVCRTELVGHEIKVCRSDVLVELADPTKADPWLRYCTRWWLTVSDPALADGLDIPPSWGIMAPPSGRRTRSMTVLRPAPELHPQTQTAALARLLAWQFARHDREATQAQRELSYRAQRIADLEAEIRHLKAGGQGRRDPDLDQALDLLRLVRHRANDSRYGMWGENVDNDLIAQAVVDRMFVAAATKDAHRELGRLIARVKAITTPFNGAYGPLAKLLKEANVGGAS